MNAFRTQNERAPGETPARHSPRAVVIGSGFGDKLTGDAKANVLYGKLGNDTLTGGVGADVFVLDTATGSGNVDTILDFTSASDKLRRPCLISTRFRALEISPNVSTKVPSKSKTPTPLKRPVPMPIVSPLTYKRRKAGKP